MPGEVINAKDVLELGRKRTEIPNESSGSGSGSAGGNVTSLDDDNNQTQPSHSTSSANPSSMEIGNSSSGGSNTVKDVERTAPTHYSNVEAVDVQISGDCGRSDGAGHVLSHESDIQQMASVHSVHQTGPEQIMSMDQQQQQTICSTNNQADGSHNAPSQNLIAHNSNTNNGQSIITHNDQHIASSAVAPSQTLISPNEQFQSQEPPGKKCKKPLITI